MNSSYISSEISLELRRQLKIQGVTQKKLASDLDVSIPTVKRWYAGKSITIETLARLTEYLGMSLAELFSNIENDENRFEYTLKQERFLAGNPISLAFYDQLVRGYTVKRILKKYPLKQTQVTSILLGLDKIKLIELHENNKVKLLNDGEPVWRANGPLAKTFSKDILDEYLAKLSDNESSFFMHNYLEKDINAIKSKVEELKQFLTLANKRAIRSKEEKIISFGTYITQSKFDWNLTNYLK